MKLTKKYVHKETREIWIATFEEEDKIYFKRKGLPLTQKSFNKIINGEIGRESDFEEIILENEKN